MNLCVLFDRSWESKIVNYIIEELSGLFHSVIEMYQSKTKDCPGVNLH